MFASQENVDVAYEILSAAINNTLISAFPFFKYPAGSNYVSLYPRLTEYLINQMPTISDIPEITNVITEITSLTNSQINEELKWGFGPEIIIQQLDDYGANTSPNTVALFDGHDHPQTIFLDVDYVLALENEPDQIIADSLIFFLGVTILHEYVHYGDYLNGNSFQSDYYDEEGNAFECLVYGINIEPYSGLFLLNKD